MRWSTRDARFRAVARRRTGIAFLVLGLGILLFLDWVAAAPRPVLAPEAGGHAWDVRQVSDATGPKPIRHRPAASGGRGGAEAAPDAPDAAVAERQPAPPRTTATNPLNALVDGSGFIRFIGFTAISLGFAVVVLVFFWSHRRDSLS